MRIIFIHLCKHKHIKKFLKNDKNLILRSGWLYLNTEVRQGGWHCTFKEFPLALLDETSLNAPLTFFTFHLLGDRHCANGSFVFMVRSHFHSHARKNVNGFFCSGNIRDTQSSGPLNFDKIFNFFRPLDPLFLYFM